MFMTGRWQRPHAADERVTQRRTPLPNMHGQGPQRYMVKVGPRARGMQSRSSRLENKWHVRCQPFDVLPRAMWPLAEVAQLVYSHPYTQVGSVVSRKALNLLRAHQCACGRLHAFPYRVMRSVPYELPALLTSWLTVPPNPRGASCSQSLRHPVPSTAATSPQTWPVVSGVHVLVADHLTLVLKQSSKLTARRRAAILLQAPVLAILLPLPPRLLSFPTCRSSPRARTVLAIGFGCFQGDSGNYGPWLAQLQQILDRHAAAFAAGGASLRINHVHGSYWWGWGPCWVMDGADRGEIGMACWVPIREPCRSRAL